MKNIMKKKIFVIALAACLLAISIAGTSMAYFTDTEQYTNVFTAGNVDITLTEAVAARDQATGNIVIANADNRHALNNEDYVYNPLFPMQQIAKDPRITNVGSEKAYVGAVITVTNGAGTIDEVLSANAVEGKTAITDFFKDLPSYAVVTEIKDGESGPVIGFEITIVFENALERNGYVTAFTGMEIPSAWDNTEMAYLNNLAVKVEAYATQVSGFATAEDALDAAFPNTFH